MSDAPGTRTDLLLVVHPERPLVLDAVPTVAVDAQYPDWGDLLGAAAALCPDGAWPHGPVRVTAAGRVSVVVACSERVAGGAAWVPAPPSGLPDPVGDAVRAVLDEDAGHAAVDARRVPWMCRGWWPEATAWVDAALAAAGRAPRTAALRPVVAGSISAVAEVTTAAGALWLKAVPGFFAREPALVPALAAVRAQASADGTPLPQVPHVVASRDDGRDGGPGGARMLTTDAGPVPDDVLPGERARLGAGLARLQVATATHLAVLRHRGRLDDRSPDALAAGLARVVEDGLWLGALDADERARLRAVAPLWQDRLRALGSSGLPPVLVHGDYHPWNVVRRPGWADGEEVAIDWTDAAHGVVGLDLVPVAGRRADPVEHDGVVAAYVRALAEGFGRPEGEVAAAVTAALPAAWVLQALAYEAIGAGSDPLVRWEHEQGQPTALRGLLAAEV
ncbi:phosphotransferase [Kineosporia sp. A_224]|uniref:phosphotransferase n=1 Tax=Kineosporia sp. A_224 TaxID=1962180 RepID=UPI000B4A7BEE|nr:phosphotransferase [Kineosporia sp. A_224]